MSSNDATLALVLGRVLIAAAWADGELSPEERAALEDLLFTLPGLDGDGWRALAADIDRPFPPEHLPILLGELRDRLAGDVHRTWVQDVLREMSGRIGEGTPEARALTEALSVATLAREGDEAGEPAGGSWWTRVRDGLRRHAETVTRALDRERVVERALDAKIRDVLGDAAAAADDDLRRLALAASILGYVVRLDDVVEAGERDALRDALVEQYQLEPSLASVVTELALDEVATGIDLHATLREFATLTTEPERQRFLAAVFRVAAGDGRASYDEIEEVRRIGRGLLLSHRHFIAAKLTLPDRFRDT